MSEDQRRGRLEGLQHAMLIVEGRRVVNHTDSYKAALDDIQVFLEASIERVKNGEEMYSVAT